MLETLQILCVFCCLRYYFLEQSTLILANSYKYAYNRFNFFSKTGDLQMKRINLLIVTALLMLVSSNVFAAGDAAAGKAAYGICGACHGMKGEGVKAMNAPRLAGQSDWYIVSSLKRFKSGARGAGDPIAATMVPMATMLSDKQMEDVAAYIGTL